MRTIYQILWIIPLFLGLGASAHAASLDDLYRDIIRSDNEGYLPLFVLNRTTPDAESKKEEVTVKPSAPTAQNETPTASQSKPINLTYDSQADERAQKAAQLKWQQTLKAVAENKVTPMELSEITYRAEKDDPKAVEVLAWMYTKGVGVGKDFVKAFKLYQKAEGLKVPKAKENAAKIYKAMSAEQKAQLQNKNQQ